MLKQNPLSNADEGIYIGTVSMNPSATTQFVLDSESPLRPQAGEGVEIVVPAGIALTEQLFCPYYRARIMGDVH